MQNSIAESILDEILVLQLTVAWAGEGYCEPKRLGWWKTDIVDSAGGGDLMQRLLPKTFAWASLEAARETAIRADAKVRSKMGTPDKMRTLFFLGFDLDEQLGERLAHHKRNGVEPKEALRFDVDFNSVFKKDTIGDLLSGLANTKYTIVPGGRQLTGAKPKSPDQLVKNIAASLVPLTNEYPMPFYGVKG